jgi:serine/threonine-protein kinase
MIGRVVLGRYRIVRALAKGGMGVVYLARGEGASGFTKPYVVKRMASDILVDDSMLKMFVREARLMSRLRHPGLVGVVDFGQEGGDYLMVIEYVHGFHLGQWHRYMRHAHGPFPVGTALHIVAKVLDGLDYAHTLRDADGTPQRIVHRDVSPSNILIDVEGIVKLADFGVARSQEHTEKTEETTIKGKMPYLAPELFRLAAPSPGTDAYACAVVLHELLVGKNEFRGNDMATTISRVLEHMPTPVDAVRDDLPDGLGDLLGRALAKDPAERYQSAGDLAAGLRAIRPQAEEDADRMLRAMTVADFLDPRMSEHLGLSSLTELENSWRNPSPDILQRDAARISSSPPTIAERPSAITPPQRTLRNMFWAVLLVLVVGGAGGAIAMVATSRDDPGGRTFVVVQNTASDSGPEDVVADPPPAIDGGAADAGRGSGQGGGARGLAAPFHRRRSEVVACFREHAGTETQITVVFGVDESGRVIAARAQPAALGSTPLGNCVLGIARSTRFSAQPRPVEFSIPLSVRPVQR